MAENTGWGSAGDGTRSGIVRARDLASDAMRATRNQIAGSARSDDVIDVTMLGSTGTGKTTLLVSMYDQFDLVIGSTDLAVVPDRATSVNLQEYLTKLSSLPGEIRVTSGLEGTGQIREYRLGVGRRGKPSLFTLRFTDYPGKYLFTPSTTDDEKLQRALGRADVVLVAIDTPALLERNGKYHEVVNTPRIVIDQLKEILKVDTPRLIILVPLKCERQLSTPQGAHLLTEAVREKYKPLTNFIGGGDLRNRVGCVLAPAQTLGSVVYSRVTEAEGNPVFHFRSLSVKVAEGGVRLAKWLVSGTLLVMTGLVIYLLLGNQSPAGWQIADTVPSPADGGASASIAPLGPSEALSAWISPASGQLAVEYWDAGTWGTSLRLPGQLDAGRYDNVKVGTGAASDAWVFASTKASGGHSYALHWDNGTLSGPVGNLPSTLFVTAACGADVAGTVQVTVPLPPPTEPAKPGRPAGKGSSAERKPGKSGKSGKPAELDNPGPSVKHLTEYIRLHWDGTRWQQARLPVPPGGGSGSISSIVASNGQVWATVTVTTAPGTRRSEILRLDGATWQQAATPAPSDGTYTLAPDGSGGLWLGADAGVDLYHYSNGHWKPSRVPSRNGRNTRVLSLAWLPEEKSLVGIGALDPSPGRVILSSSS